MKFSRIYISAPHWGGLEQDFIKEAFDSNWISSGGSNVASFEQNLEKYLENNFFVKGLCRSVLAAKMEFANDARGLAGTCPVQCVEGAWQ